MDIYTAKPIFKRFDFVLIFPVSDLFSLFVFTFPFRFSFQTFSVLVNVNNTAGDLQNKLQFLHAITNQSLPIFQHNNSNVAQKPRNRATFCSTYDALSHSYKCRQ